MAVNALALVIDPRLLLTPSRRNWNSKQEIKPESHLTAPRDAARTTAARSVTQMKRIFAPRARGGRSGSPRFPASLPFPGVSRRMKMRDALGTVPGGFGIRRTSAGRSA